MVSLSLTLIQVRHGQTRPRGFPPDTSAHKTPFAQCTQCTAMIARRRWQSGSVRFETSRHESRDKAQWLSLASTVDSSALFVKGS